MKGKKKMKKKTKEILEILKGFMINSELKNHTAEIVLYKKVIATLRLLPIFQTSWITMKKAHYILVQKLMLKN